MQEWTGLVKNLKARREGLVEPAGFEPAAFPVLPGRAHQALYEPPILLPLDLDFTLQGFGPRGVLFMMDELPRTAILQGSRVICVVIADSLLEILRLTNIKATSGFAL
jgi:hypothetical protein